MLDVGLLMNDLGREHIGPFRSLSYLFFGVRQCSKDWEGYDAVFPARWCLLVACRRDRQTPRPRHIAHADPSPLTSCMDSEAMLSARGGKAEYCPCPRTPATCPLLALHFP